MSNSAVLTTSSASSTQNLSDLNLRGDRLRKDYSMMRSQWWDDGLTNILLQSEEMNGEGPFVAARETRDIYLDQSALAAYVKGNRTLEPERVRGSKNNLGSSADLPFIDACICILQEHRNAEGHLCAWKIYLQICAIGLETHSAIGNHLVPMFVGCGDTPGAEQVACRLMHLNEFSWTAVILSYAQAGNIGYAVILYQKMLNYGIFPSSYTFVGLLKACADSKDLERGHEFHREIVQQALDIDLHVGSTLVYMYANCASFQEAHKVFDKLPARNVVSWTAMISAYSEIGSYQEALDLFDHMEQDCIPPNSWTFACVIRACSFVESIDKALELHSEAVQKGLEEDLYVGNALVFTYIKLALISEAQSIFEKIKIQSTVSWNILIAGFAEARSDEDVLSCFRSMSMGGIPPNAATLAYVVKACGSLGSIERGFKAHKKIILTAVEKDPPIANCLIGMYAKCGLLSESQKVFDELETPSNVSWTALIGGYAEYEDGEHALDSLKQMQYLGLAPDSVTFACALKACNSIGRASKVFEIHKEVARKGLDIELTLGVALIDVYASCGLLCEAQEVFKKLSIQDVVSWTALISGYAEKGLVQDAMSLLTKMQTEGVIPDAVACSCILKACGMSRNIDKGRELYMDILKKGLETDASVNNKLIDMYAKCGLSPDAQDIFDKLPVRDAASWTSLIAGYAEQGYSQQALKCLECLQLRGVLGDAVMFSCCLKACGNIQAVPEGQRLHRDIVLQGLEIDPLVGNTLIGMYAKWGWFIEAEDAFESLPVRDVVSWNALIAGYTECDGLEALVFLEQMQGQGACPDAVTLGCALKACGSTGALERGQGLHSNIVMKGLDNDTTIGNCLINTYSMCGSILEAHYVFDSMRVQDVVAWCTLIKGYGMNHDGKMAVQLFEDMQVEGVKPHALVFSSLLTACSHSGQTITGEKYFKVMREEFNVIPTQEHYNCMADLLARSGHLYEAEKFIEAFCQPYEGSWASLLTACKTCEERDLGLRCFQQLLCIDSDEAAWYVIMADININTNKGDCSCYELEYLRKHAGVMKMPASALIEVNSKLHEFVVGNHCSTEVSAKLKVLNSHLKEEGHVPKVNAISKPIFNEQKEIALSEHAEKLAIAFGLLNTRQGETLRISKSLRMCNDCHNASKIISKVERREIILRDTSCIHHFKEGLCSCGDMF